MPDGSHGARLIGIHTLITAGGVLRATSRAKLALVLVVGPEEALVWYSWDMCLSTVNMSITFSI